MRNAGVGASSSVLASLACDLLPSLRIQGSASSRPPWGALPGTPHLCHTPRGLSVKNSFHVLGPRTGEAGNGGNVPPPRAEAGSLRSRCRQGRPPAVSGGRWSPLPPAAPGPLACGHTPDRPLCLLTPPLTCLSTRLRPGWRPLLRTARPGHGGTPALRGASRPPGALRPPSWWPLALSDRPLRCPAVCTSQQPDHEHRALGQRRGPLLFPGTEEVLVLACLPGTRG